MGINFSGHYRQVAAIERWPLRQVWLYLYISNIYVQWYLSLCACIPITIILKLDFKDLWSVISKFVYLHSDCIIFCKGEVPWYIGLNPWLSIKELRVRFPSMSGTFVFQQDTLSTLLLSTQVYKWVPGRMRTLLCCLMWHVCTPEVAPGQNAPQGVENVHYECRIDIESNTWG